MHHKTNISGILDAKQETERERLVLYDSMGPMPILVFWYVRHAGTRLFKRRR